MKIRIIILITAFVPYFIFAWFAHTWGDIEYEEQIIKEMYKENTNNFYKTIQRNQAVPWTNQPVFQGVDSTNQVMSVTDRVTVLTTLLTADREEIRVWQERLFSISFWVNAAILAIVSAVLGLEEKKAVICDFAAVVCASLSFVYFCFIRITVGAMAANDHDLCGIQYALGLCKNGWYLMGQAIYGGKNESYGAMGHSYIGDLVLINIVFTSVSLLLFLAYFPYQQQKRQQKQSADKTKGK